jgi:phospholipid/cholesterol/gamma-HCH transport system ATP-binding protein
MSTTQPASTDRKPIVEVSDLHFGYNGRKIFDGLNLTIPRGKVTVIMGPSGCGKSTLLGFFGGRLKPLKGRVMFDGEEVPFGAGERLYTMRRNMGMLFQSSALLTDLSVFENVAFPLREQTDLPEPLIRILVLMKLELVGLRGARDLMPSSLSGGMSRRVALARAIVLDPAMIMYDEPFVGLDPISMGVIVKLIRELNDAMGLTSVVVTHDVHEGCSIADHVCLLGKGRVIGSGTPQEMLESDQPETRQFMLGLPDGPVGYHYPAEDYIADLGGDV